MRATRGWGAFGLRRPRAQISYTCGVRSLEAARRRCQSRMRFPKLAWSIATGRPATAPSHAPPMSKSCHIAIQPQTTTDGDRDEDDHQHLGAIRQGGAVVARELRRHTHVRGHSVEAELVALD